MALPLVVAPVFALYTTNKNATFNYEVTTDKEAVVNFNQYLNFDSNVSSTSWISGTYSVNDNQLFVDVDASSSTISRRVMYLNLNVVPNHKYYCRAVGTFEDLFLYDATSSVAFNFNTVNSFTESYTFQLNYYKLGGLDSSVSYDFYLCVFDLTQMFGVGVEPNIDLFNTYFPNDYYYYNTGTDVLITSYPNVTYNDTDVGSQFIYSMYNCVDKYFNYDRVFNFGSLYSWLQLNFFSGQAPLGFFIFWHLLEYWLLTSLLWLLFDVLIYVPMLVHRWLDKASLS